MEKALTNRTQTLTERMTMEICVIGILNQLLMGDSYAQIKFSKMQAIKNM